MQLSIISLKGVEFEGEIISVNLKTTSGEITVLDKHRPLITELKKGKVAVIKKGGEKYSLDVKSGFLEVNADNQATILAN